MEIHFSFVRICGLLQGRKGRRITMKSKLMIFERAGQPLRLEECEIPPLKAGEVLVKNEYATLCRSDISTYLGRRIEKSPTILGHEIVGRVAALGGICLRCKWMYPPGR